MKSVAFHNLGCKVNGYEMDYMQQIMKEKGYPVVPFDGKADIYIINTCTVTNIADRKSRQMIHQAKKRNPECVVVAVGCYVQAGGEEALKDHSIDLAIGNNRKKDLVAILEEYLAKREAPRQDLAAHKTLGGKTVIDIAGAREYESMSLASTAEHTRAYIKVQDGCNQFCSYCIIPYARGRVRSRARDEILGEVSALAGNGYREVVLTGIHLSSYGLDGEKDPSGSRLLSLIQEVGNIPGIVRIRLGSLEPRIITPQFARGLRDCPGVCPHFHLSLQSGADTVLKRMNRKYTAEEYYEKVCILRECFENPAITTDVIAGFPGETEVEFGRTEDFLRKVGFYEMHVFRYSKRKGTPAAVMEGQLPEKVKALRSSRLLSLNLEMSRSYREMYLNRKVQTLFEEEKAINGLVYQVGHTREYIRAALPGGERLSGRVLTGELTGFLEPDLMLFRQ